MNNKLLYLTLFCCIIFSKKTSAQTVSIFDDGSSTTSSAVLDVQSTTRGLLIPRLTTTQRTNISNPALGLLVFDSDTESFWFHDDNSWAELVSGSIDDADADPSNEFQSISKFGNTVTLSNGGGSFTDNVNDADASTTNELQSLSISDSELTISNGNTINLHTDLMKDADDDTKIQVEENSDEDIIRFDVKGAEMWRMEEERIEPAASNIYIGNDAGKSSSGSNNIFIGNGAGQFENSLFGNKLYIENSNTNSPLIFGDFFDDFVKINGGLRIDDGFEDDDGDTKIQVEESLDEDMVRIDLGGTEKLRLSKNSAGDLKIEPIGNKDNTLLGESAGAFNVSGTKNTYLGQLAGGGQSTGSQNVMVGVGAGATSGGSGHVFLGYSAGNAFGGNNKLCIANSGTFEPLIYGEFDNAELAINGDLSIDIHNGTSETTGELRFQKAGTSRYSIRYFSTNDYFAIREDDQNDNVFYVEDGMVGIQRRPTTNDLEVNGTASKSSAGDWLANSDARLKKNILPLQPEKTLEKVLSLRGLTYEWDDEQTGNKRPLGTQYGFTAQNIQAVFPELVSEDANGFLQTSYSTFDAMLVESLRAMNDKIEKLEKENNELKAAVNVLLQNNNQAPVALKKE